MQYYQNGFKPSDPRIKPATETDWLTEYLDAILSVRVVDGFDDADVRFDPTRPSTIPVRLMDDGLARRELGWEPRISLDEGLSRTIEYFRGRQADGGL